MISNTSQYLNILVSVKEEIQSSRCKAALRVNSELILLYWKIGSILLAQDTRGSRFIENLSKDLLKEYPEMKRVFCKKPSIHEKICSVGARFPNCADSVCKIILVA